MAECVACLADQDVVVLAQELKKAELIKEEVVDHLSNFSPEVPNSVKHRYLFSQVYTETKASEEAFMKMVHLLLKFPSRPLLTTTIVDNIKICSEHIPIIAEALAEHASKWDLIGTSLNFPQAELSNIQDCIGKSRDSSKRMLLLLLEKWVNRGIKHALPASVGSLKRALNSNLVGLGALTDRISETFSLLGVASKVARQSSPHVILSARLFDKWLSACQKEVFEAKENESVLFEVVETTSLESKEYQWVINSRNIGSTKTQFLCVKAEIDMTNNQYLCRVSGWEKFILKDQCYVETQCVTLHVSSPLDDIKDDLISMYLAKPEVPTDSWPPISSKKYINLALIRQEAVDYMKKSTQFTLRGDLDDVLKDKEVIEYEGQITSLKRGTVLLIEGRPGSGKTTFVHKVTRDWALSPQKYLKTIRSLFLVSLRVLNTLNKPLDLTDILNLFKKVKVSKSLVEKREGKGACFIFDGLDEFSPPDGEDSIVYKIIRKEYLTNSIVIVASRPVATAHLRSKANKVIEVLGFKEDQIYEYFDHYPFSKNSKSNELKRYLAYHPNILHMCYLPIHAVMVAYLFEVTGSVPRTETEIYTHFTRFMVMRTVLKGTDLKIRVTDIQSLGKDQEFQNICQLALEKTILNEQVMCQNEVDLISGDKGEDAYLGLVTIDRTADLYGYANVYTFLHLTFQEYLAARHISTLDYEKQIAFIQMHGDKDHMLMVWKFFCGLVCKFNISTIDRRFQLFLDMKNKDHFFHIQCAYESHQDIPCTQVLKRVNYHIQIRDKHHISIPDFTAVGFVTSKSVISTKLSIVKCNFTTGIMHALAAEMKQNNKLKKLKIKQSLNKIESVKELASFLQHGTIFHLKELDIRSNAIDDTGAEIIAEALVNFTGLRRLAISENKLSYIGVRKLFKHFDDIKIDYVDIIPQSSLDQNCLPPNSQDGSLLSALIDWPSIQFLSFTVQLSMCTIDLFGKNWKRKIMIDCSASATFYKCFMDAPELQTLSIKAGAISSSECKEVSTFLDSCRCLQVLDLSNNSIEDKAAQACFSHVEACFNLVEINLESNRIDCIDIQAFSWIQKFPRLQKLNLGNNNLSKGSGNVLSSCLQHCPDLLVLNLDNNAIGTAGLIAILRQLSHLQELHLGNNRIGSEGAKALAAHLQQKCNLHTHRLSLKGNEIGRDGIKALLQSLVHCPNLKELDLSGNFIGVKGVKMITKSLKSDAAHIEKLHLNSSQVFDDGAVNLASHLKHFDKLQSLCLMNNRIGRIGIQALAEGFGHCPCLQSIDLSTNNFGLAEIITLSVGLQNCHSLSELHLADNKIECDGIKALSLNLIHYRNLQGLNLSNNIIANDGAKVLAENLKNCTKLVWLCLPGNLISQEAALAVVSGINQCTDFKKLDLSRNRIANSHTLQAKLTCHSVTIITE